MRLHDILPDSARRRQRSATWQVGRATIGALLRRHALFLVLLVCGTALRGVVQWAYRPAFLYFDTPRYLENIDELNPAGQNPLGYTLLAKVALSVVHNLTVLAVINHLFAVAMGVLLYTMLVRRGVRTTLAALGVAPVLLDAYQLVIEHMVISDVLFEFLVVCGLVLLLWKPRPSLLTAGAAGFFFASAALTRYVGEPLVLAGVLYCVLAARGARARVSTAAVHALVFAAPLLCYAGYNASYNGQFALPSDAVATRLYARVASVADCESLRLPSYERVLCPPKGTVQPRSRSLVQGYQSGTNSPLLFFRPPPGMTEEQVLNDFVGRVVRHQPVTLAAAVGKTFLRPFFFWHHDRLATELDTDRWRFHVQYHPFFPHLTNLELARWGGGPATVNATAGTWLLRYQLGPGYTPGPILFGCLVVGLAAAAGVGRARRSGQRAACLLLVVVGAGLLLSADIYLFSWRYQLPALVTLPPAAALGLSALQPTWARAPGPDRRAAEPVASDEDAPTPGPARKALDTAESS